MTVLLLLPLGICWLSCLICRPPCCCLGSLVRLGGCRGRLGLAATCCLGAACCTVIQVVCWGRHLVSLLQLQLRCCQLLPGMSMGPAQNHNKSCAKKPGGEQQAAKAQSTPNRVSAFLAVSRRQKAGPTFAASPCTPQHAPAAAPTAGAAQRGWPAAAAGPVPVERPMRAQP